MDRIGSLRQMLIKHGEGTTLPCYAAARMPYPTQHCVYLLSQRRVA